MIVVASGLIALALGGSAPAGFVVCTPSWRPVAVGGTVADRARFAGIAATAHDDVWAVGSTGVGDETQVLFGRFDGERFATLASNQAGFLTGVAAVSRSEAWAVGATTDIVADSEPLIIRWNGVSWQRLALPSLRGGQLNDVVAIDRNDVWAVGQVFETAAYRPLFLHWDGREWSATVDRRYNGQLFTVTALTPKDVVAAGTAGRRGKAALVVRWNGRQWNAMRPLAIGAPNEIWYPSISGIDGARPSSVWAVGTLAAGPLVQYWNGKKWRLVHLPLAHFEARYDGGEDSALGDVVALTEDNVWAVGFGIEHWDGRTWKRHRLYREGGLSALSALSAREIWAAGATFRGGPLIERYSCR